MEGRLFFGRRADGPKKNGERREKGGIQRKKFCGEDGTRGLSKGKVFKTAGRQRERLQGEEKKSENLGPTGLKGNGG